MLTIRSREEALQKRRDQMIDELIYPIETDQTEFKEAFKTKFKKVCDEIKAFLGLEEFKGSLDDIMKLEAFIIDQDPSTEEGKRKILEASILETRWNSADKLCRYLGARLGWRQPQWFEEGWKMVTEDKETEE